MKSVVRPNCLQAFGGKKGIPFWVVVEGGVACDNAVCASRGRLVSINEADKGRGGSWVCGELGIVVAGRPGGSLVVAIALGRRWFGGGGGWRRDELR